MNRYYICDDSSVTRSADVLAVFPGLRERNTSVAAVAGLEFGLLVLLVAVPVVVLWTCVLLPDFLT